MSHGSMGRLLVCRLRGKGSIPGLEHTNISKIIELTAAWQSTQSNCQPPVDRLS